MYKHISKIDTDRFGFVVAKLPENCENPRQMLQELKKINTKLVLVRVNLNNLELINELEMLGFLTKDIQLSYSYNLDNPIPSLLKNEFEINYFESKYQAQIIDIVKNSFLNYGHYFADNKLDKQKCKEIYPDWAYKCCTDKSIADEIVLAIKDDIVLGFLALKLRTSKDFKYVTGVIGAVSPEYRSWGVFQAINVKSMLWSKTINAKHIENNVLATNLPVIKTYTSLNYQVIRSEITMHYWFE